MKYDSGSSSEDIDHQEESKVNNTKQLNPGVQKNDESLKKRGRKKTKGKELQDILEQCKNISGINEGDNKSLNDKNSSLRSVGKRKSKRIMSPAKFHNYDNLMSTEEERMIKLAIKNSLIETKN